MNITERPKQTLRLGGNRRCSTYPHDDSIALAWTDTQLKYDIPHRYAEQLMDGVARDLRQNRYDTFEELTTYSYSVASTVGLMSMHIIGYSDEDAIPFAIKLGVALQTTNILRDVGDDWRMGLIYLPWRTCNASTSRRKISPTGRCTSVGANSCAFRSSETGSSTMKPDPEFDC